MAVRKNENRSRRLGFTLYYDTTEERDEVQAFLTSEGRTATGYIKHLVSEAMKKQGLQHRKISVGKPVDISNLMQE